MPSREYVVTPLFDIWKKPLPLIATFSDDVLEVIVPWLNCCCTDASIVPMPIGLLTADATEFAYMSENCAVLPLKPTVFAFAMLLPITSRSLDAPAKPLKPC
ncbi:hypothetical protein Y049_2237 [Burkholderia pseudomallei MSHR684]|nr:hypothetical protein Y049_2237 [Burkholderia pseudomallei MSHR684]